jgi:glutaredoxin/uncharacterized protein (DUF302 family)
MNIAYFRKSRFGVPETVTRLTAAAKERGFTLLGEIDLPKAKSKALSICRPEWIDRVVGADPRLAGLLPCSVLVIERDGTAQVGMTDPALLGSIAGEPDVVALATEAEASVKDLVHAAAGVEPLKAVGVRLYSTKSCPYCKAEATWLDQQKFTYELVKVDENQEEAERMLRHTGQLGVPVTEIVYDEGDPQFVLGFDRPKLAQALGLKN